MGNSKHSTVSTSVSLPDQGRSRFQKVLPKRRKSDPNNYADVELGRLRSVDFRLADVMIESGDHIIDGLLLDRLWSPNTFLFLRTCERNHNGFGFTCDISMLKEHGGQDGLFVVRQMAKPKRGFKGTEDSPLDVFEVNPQFQRQVLGLIVKKLDQGMNAMVLEGVTVFCIQGVLGHILVKEDWTDSYEIQNADGEPLMTAKRFNRISGGVEFQIYSAIPSLSKTDGGTVIATLVRLEEAKFILKLYSPVGPAFKGLVISFVILFMYLTSR